MSDLRRDATRGVRWSAVGQVARQAIALGTLLLLTGLVGPEGFGLMSMALTVTGFVDLLRDLGTGAAVVQRRDLTPALLSTVFWLNAGLGLVSALAVAAGAPLAALFYGEPAVTGLLRALAASFLIVSLSVVHQALLQRAVAFRAIAAVELASGASGAAAAVVAALAGAGVWSLVAQSLVTSAVATPLYWLASRWVPRLSFDRAAARSIGGFSAGLVGFNVVNYFARNADYLIIGRFLGPASLGIYTLAYRLMLYPIQLMSQVASRVMYPVLSQLEEGERFAGVYLRLSATVFFLAAPVYVLLGALGGPAAAALLGPDWAPVAPLLPILAPVGLFQALVNPTGLIYQARGRTDLLFAWGVGSSLLMVASFVLGLPWGITGVAAGYALSMLLLAYPAFRLPFGLVGLPVAALPRALAPAALCALAMLAASLGIWAAAPGLAPAARVVAAAAGAALVYLGLSWRLNPGPLAECLRLVGLPAPRAARRDTDRSDL